VFAALVLILESLDHSTQSTALACAVYFWARLVHAVSYAIGIKVVRTLSFAVGWAACAVLVLVIFRVIV
jgi:uncharacterized MAPEG superfamily protein